LRKKGTIVNSQGKFAFVDIDDEPGSESVFIHISNCSDQIKELRIGMRLEFDIVASSKKPGTFAGENIVLLSVDFNENEGKKDTEIPREQVIFEKNVLGKIKFISKEDNVISVRAKTIISGSQSKFLVNSLVKFVDQGGTVLILNLKEDKLGVESQPFDDFIPRRKFVFNKLKTFFGEYSIEDCPMDRINISSKSHPLISELCNCAYVLSKSGISNKLVKRYRKIFETEILENVYPTLIKKAAKHWTVIGDETGSFSEYVGKQDKHKIPATMVWLAVPPNSKLPNLSPSFHATGNEKSLIKALQHIDATPDVLIFSFTYEEGKIISGVGSSAKDPHLSKWNETLPLVLESLSNHVTEDTVIDVFSEQVKQLKAGMNFLEGPILDLKTALNDRVNWGKMYFKEMKILAKSPCEHPWMGYSDAIGHFFNEKKMQKLGMEYGDLFERIDKRIVKSPFRQKSLNSVVKPLLKDTSRPLFFLQSLHSVNANDLRDYVRPFLLNAIIEARESLSNSDWQTLLEHFKNTAETIEGQHAANLIVEGIDVDSMMDRFTRPMDRYIFLKSVLGSSNHVGTTKIANKCKVYINELLDDGLKLSIREHRKLKSLQGGASDNQFDWAHIIDFEDLDEFAEDDVLDWNEETQHFFGSQALSRALRNETRDWDEALEIENKLRSIHQSNEQYRRRFILYSELMMMKSEFDEAKKILEIEFPKHIGESDNKLHLSDRYYLASLLKACASSDSVQSFHDYSKLVLNSLNEKHPSQRIAYWYCRWVHQLLQTGLEEHLEGIGFSVLESCLNHLLSLKNYDFFKKEAPGVILACELIDLNKRGLIEEEHESFLEQVLANSEVFANEWVENNYPNEDDWLAPLNFNYR